MVDSKREEVQDVRQSTRGDYAIFGVLFIANILNYMDRYTMAGVLSSVQTDFQISDAQGGLLQTVFIFSLAIGSPLFGYLGDRYSRKWLMVGGLLMWTFSVLGSSFIPKTSFVGLLVMRGLFGFGQSAYITVAPSLIADLFTGSKRATMLMLFYFGIPVGSGLGFIVGSTVAGLASSWRWGVRATAIGDAACLILIALFVREIPRGMAEGEKEEKDNVHSSYSADLISLFRNATFLTSSLAYTAVVFVTGTLSWWVPTAMQHIAAHNEHLNTTSQLDESAKSASAFSFGVITMISGFTGVAAGTILSNMLSSGKWCFACVKTPRSDPIICAVGAAIGIPTFFAATQLLANHMLFAQICIFLCITGLCFMWATNVNLCLSVVSADKRNSANGLQILLSHVLGDGSGPYIIGAISDAIRGDRHSPYDQWHSLYLSFFVANGLLVPAVVLFIVAAMTYPRDRAAYLKSLPPNNAMPKTDNSTETGASVSKISPSDQSPMNKAFDQLEESSNTEMQLTERTALD